jgi:glutamyl-Q tRNA(Asp) synthetase
VSDLESSALNVGRYIGRFAPSPTGPLHFGSLVAALASYVDAKANDGVWFVRIEDVDSQRCHREHEVTIMHQLSAYGLVHDGQVVRQSERAIHYAAALEALQKKGYVYRCRCTRKQLANASRNRDGETIYPGRCRDLEQNASNDLATSIRLNLSALRGSTQITFADRAMGNVVQNVGDEVGDFVLHRADGDFAYQLAVVMDDAFQGITHIVRGGDLLSNTARQIVLQRALGVATPSYLHVPVVTNENGEKLSKQTRAPALPNDPQAKLKSLRDAWRFLRQSDVSDCDSCGEFLERAVAQWRPERLQLQQSANL